MAYKQASPIIVREGGTGLVTMTTAYAPVCAGTTATGALQVASTDLATSGFVLTSTGASSLPTWQAAPGSSALTFTEIDNTDSPYTVLSGDRFIIADTSGGAISILLANAPTTGRIVTIKDKDGSALINNITVTTVGGTVTIDGTTSVTMNTSYQAMNVTFDSAAYYIY